ncbi:MAG: hypothetical protein AAGI23_11620 [Bacteroidota bacterium]
MRNYLFLMIALMASLTTFQAQDLAYTFNGKTTASHENDVRIHLTYLAPNGWGMGKYRLQTNLQEEPIKILNDDYTLLVSDQEKIAFFENDKVNNLPLALTFERGKDYYFRITNLFPIGSAVAQYEVDELTEREFQMQLFANDISPKPIIYDLRSGEAKTEQ